jgi:hypothetical protein
VILQNRDNKYKEGPFEEEEVARETGDWLDPGMFDLTDLGQSDSVALGPENTV